MTDAPTHSRADSRPRAALADVRATPLSIDEVLEAVDDPRAGAVALFVGQVRDHDHGQAVTGLEYSAHPSVIEVAREVAERHGATDDVIKVAVVHRIGSLAIGDLAIVAAVSAAHRGTAFEVCHAMVDDFKAGVPIWKHQSFADGTDEWVGMP